MVFNHIDPFLVTFFTLAKFKPPLLFYSGLKTQCHAYLGFWRNLCYSSSVYSETTFQEDSFSKCALAKVELLYNFLKSERPT